MKRASRAAKFNIQQRSCAFKTQWPVCKQKCRTGYKLDNIGLFTAAINGNRY